MSKINFEVMQVNKNECPLNKTVSCDECHYSCSVFCLALQENIQIKYLDSMCSVCQEESCNRKE